MRPRDPRVIILGITPGLKSLAYSVMNVSGPPEVIDHDILLGGRIEDSLTAIAKKAYVHALILDVVFERDPPLVLAIGPPCNRKEPPAHIAAVQLMLVTLARKFGVRITSLDETLMNTILTPSPRESLQRVVSRRLGTPLDSSDRRIVLASAIALAGGVLVERGQL